MNLGSFLADPPAADFLFLQPLVRCAQPAPAKAAFFAALPKLKIAVKAIADGAELSPPPAAAVAWSTRWSRRSTGRRRRAAASRDLRR